MIAFQDRIKILQDQTNTILSNRHSQERQRQHPEDLALNKDLLVPKEMQKDSLTLSPSHKTQAQANTNNLLRLGTTLASTPSQNHSLIAALNRVSRLPNEIEKRVIK